MTLADELERAVVPDVSVPIESCAREPNAVGRNVILELGSGFVREVEAEKVPSRPDPTAARADGEHQLPRFPHRFPSGRRWKLGVLVP